MNLWASYTRAIEIEPTLADIRNNYAGVLVASGKIDEGIEYFKQAIEMDPTFAWTHSHLSFVYRLKGNHAASVEERARSLELLDRSDDARRLRASFASGGWTDYLRELLRQDWGPLAEPARAELVFLRNSVKRKKRSAVLLMRPPGAITGSSRSNTTRRSYAAIRDFRNY